MYFSKRNDISESFFRHTSKCGGIVEAKKNFEFIQKELEIKQNIFRELKATIEKLRISTSKRRLNIGGLRGNMIDRVQFIFKVNSFAKFNLKRTEINLLIAATDESSWI